MNSIPRPHESVIFTALVSELLCKYRVMMLCECFKSTSNEQTKACVEEDLR